VHDFRSAKLFVQKHHPECLKWVYARQRLTANFDEFFDEFAYCIIASGFRAVLAARFAPLLAQKARETSDLDEMLKIF